MDETGVNEAFFRRYRELLDAEDATFDELEHAYEDGDRAHWSDDYTAWKARGSSPPPRPDRPSSGLSARGRRRSPRRARR
jgi:hypothetical protein